MHLRKFFIIFFLPISFGIEVSYTKLSEENKNLIEAFKIIRNDLRQTFHTKGLALLSINDPEFIEIHEALKLEIIKYVFANEKLRIINPQHSFFKKAKFSLILLDNLKVFRESEKLIDDQNFEYSGCHFIIILDSNLVEIQEIFTSFWSKGFYNVYILMNIYEETLLLTFNLFDDTQNCGKVSVKVINSFRNGKFARKLGPWKKFLNMNKCPITVTTYTDTIAVFKQNLPNGCYILRGYEYEMIKYIADILNFSLVLNYKEGKQEWGVVFENGTCTRGFQDLKDKKTDILMGDLYLKELRAKYFDTSTPYLNYPLFFILTPQPKLNMLQKLLSPFKIEVWIFLSIIFVIGISTILAINFKFKNLKKLVYGDRVSHPMTNLLNGLIGQPQNQLPRRNFARLLLMTFLIFSLVIRSTYQGSLYKFLQSDGRHKEPQTIAELIDRKYTFIIAKTNVDIIKDSLPQAYSLSYIMEENEEVDLDITMKYSKQSAGFAAKSTLMNYSLTNDNFPYKICKEHFVTFNIAMFYNKKFFLKSAIDEAIQMILGQGLMDKWINEYDKTDKWNFIDRKPSVLTFEHLSGAFSLLIFGYVLAGFIALGEKIYFKLKIKQRDILE